MNKEELEILEYVFSLAYKNCLSCELKGISDIEDKLIKIIKELRNDR